MKESIYYTKPDSQPAWMIFMNFEGIENSEAENAQSILLKQFDERKIVDIGEMLHLFALRFMMAEHDLIDRSFSDIEGECKEYINDVRRVKRLLPKEIAWNPSDSIQMGYRGYPYWVTDKYKTHFVDVYKALNVARGQVLRDSFKELSEEVLDALNDGETFFEKMCNAAKGSGKFAAAPVLTGVDVNKFFEAWMATHPKNWYWISSALIERQKISRADVGLEDEGA